MNSIQIRCFLEAARYHSFSKAADALYISQSSVSRNISLMEEELGLSLFRRSSFHGIELTGSGELMKEAFEAAERTIFSALDKAQQQERLREFSLTLGLLESQLLDDRLEKILSHFRTEYPNVTLRIVRNDYQRLMEGLQADTVDIVYMPQWQLKDRTELSVHFIGEMETVLVIPKRLIPALEDRVYSVRDFQELPFITVNEQESRPSRDMMLDLFQSLGISPPVCETASMQEQIQKVEMGEAIILINPYNSVCYSPNVTCVHARELLPQPFAVAWKKDPSAQGIKLFRDFLDAQGQPCRKP